jgi:hypothetical protein
MRLRARKAYTQGRDGLVLFWVQSGSVGFGSCRLLLSEGYWESLGSPKSFSLQMDLCTVNDQFDSWSWATCWICGHKSNHWGQDHGLATGDGLTRYDIVAHMNHGGYSWRS